MKQISQWIDEAIASVPVYDLHTHLYPANFGALMLWGIDELLTYHYLIAEALRVSDMGYERFWAMPRKQQAGHIWEKLFVERAPISEACRGVLTVLKRLGLDERLRDLQAIREFFHDQRPAEHVETVFRLANVRQVVMTNDPLDPAERKIWEASPQRDSRFKAALRIDPLLLGWPGASEMLAGCGYNASADLSETSLKEIRRFLSEWANRLQAMYVAVSLPPTWRYPDDTPATRVIDEAVLPVAGELNLPFAMMIGVTRQANPRLRMAGDSVGRADMSSVERICASNPRNKFLATVLSRENQHELAVAARKHRNLMIFGCWWFVNNPSLVEEITRMRVELLGTSFIPQHSDARVLDQLIYKWEHSRSILAKVLKDKFNDLAIAGWPVDQEEIQRTTALFLHGNLAQFLTSRPAQ